VTLYGHPIWDWFFSVALFLLAVNRSWVTIRSVVLGLRSGSIRTGRVKGEMIFRSIRPRRFWLTMSGDILLAVFWSAVVLAPVAAILFAVL
jgi:hypothetical protein